MMEFSLSTWLMFFPVLVVRVSHGEKTRMSEDMWLSSSMRKYLLNELELLGQALPNLPIKQHSR